MSGYPIRPGPIPKPKMFAPPPRPGPFGAFPACIRPGPGGCMPRGAVSASRPALPPRIPTAPRPTVVPELTPVAPGPVVEPEDTELQRMVNLRSTFGYSKAAIKAHFSCYDEVIRVSVYNNKDAKDEDYGFGFVVLRTQAGDRRAMEDDFFKPRPAIREQIGPKAGEKIIVQTWLFYNQSGIKDQDCLKHN